MSKVLLIDDQDTLRAMVRDILEDWNEALEIEDVDNGFEGLKLLQNGDYDLLICDIMMPDLNGFEVLHAVRKQCPNPEMPILMLTAETEPESIARGVTLGATSYLTKPFNGEELIQCVQALLK